jgi:hypothetical protein
MTEEVFFEKLERWGLQWRSPTALSSALCPSFDGCSHCSFIPAAFARTHKRFPLNEVSAAAFAVGLDEHLGQHIAKLRRLLAG